MKTFEVKEEHVKLLRNAYVEWQEGPTGAPGMDTKRPYGNSAVANDVAEILGWEIQRCPHCGEEIGELSDWRTRALALHRETEQALQIFLATGEMRVGKYEADPYKNNWKLVEEEED